ncbi:hypothetical protein C0J52_01529 [Blattella germanica]|nr:hypothetical protein C0J52_01529 [Blattella germanica]
MASCAACPQSSASFQPGGPSYGGYMEDIDPCTGDIKKEEMGQTSIMAVPGGSSCYMPQSDLNEPSGPVTSTKEGVTCYCPELSPQSQNAAYLPQPENRSVAAHTACQPDPCVCDIPPCQSQQQQQQGGKPPPCVLPQLRDMFPKPERVTAEGQEDQKMGVIGPWATGRVDWGPLSDLTGTRPVVDKYTITRYSDGEWRKHNADVLGGAEKEVHHANVVDFNGRQCASFTAADTDKKQNDNTRRLSQRAHDVHRYKVELEHAIMAMADEINMMERQRQQLKTAMGILRMPESIAGECLDRRATRLEPDLVRDKAEEELVKERSLIGEIRDLMERMLKQMEEQLKHDKAVKSRTEMDWSDKKEAYEIEATNVGLRNTSTTLLFRPGAARFPDGSVELRHFLESFLADMARDLRMQADRVDTALAMKIAETNEIRMRLENELLKTLRRIADTERLIADLKQAIRNQDAAMKKAQTRLDNRLLRPRQENCRDIPQYGVSALKAQLKQAEESLQGLLTTRGDLEREIIVKRKSLFIDRDRCQEIRSHYPSTVALTGH